MSKTEYAWTIQNNDNMYVVLEYPLTDRPTHLGWHYDLYMATFMKESTLKLVMKWYKPFLQNCQPVKVKIEIVGEDYE